MMYLDLVSLTEDTAKHRIAYNFSVTDNITKPGYFCMQSDLSIIQRAVQVLTGLNLSLNS